MSDLAAVAPKFVAMAQQIVWCTVATVDGRKRPRSRVLHPIWEFDGSNLVGWIATAKTTLKVENMNASPNVSCNHWTPAQDTCVAKCAAQWVEDKDTKHHVWDLFVNGPEPVAYDPSMIPGWDNADSEGFNPLRLDPWLLRVMPGSSLMDGSYAADVWQR